MFTLLLVGMLTLTFNIQPVKSAWTGTVYIRADGSIDPPSAPIITYDNITYTLTDNITSSADGIIIKRGNIIINGNDYTLQGTGSGKGILLSERSNVTIKNVKIIGFSYGILLSRVQSNNIIGNEVTQNDLGIIVYVSDGNTITNNTVANNNHGIRLEYSCNNTLAYNNMTNNLFNFGIHGEQQSHFVNNIDASNTVNNKLLYYLTQQRHITINSSTLVDIGYLALINSTNVQVEGLMFKNNYQGLLLAYTTDSVIKNLDIVDNYYGISLVYSHSNIIVANTITNSLYSGIFVGWNSTNNSIFHNIFENNTNQVYGTYKTNAWDNGYPSGGNYWSDYPSVDLYSGPYQNETGSDGIGDTAKIIDANNIDRYPLIAPFNTFKAGVWNGTAYNVDVIGNSTVSRFHFNPSEGALLRFNVTGEDGTTGFCRVTIPKPLLWVQDGQWSVLVDGEPVTYTIILDENCTYLYFTYSHTTKMVTIQGTDVIPEFPSNISLLTLLMLATVPLILTKKIRYRKAKT